MKTTLIICLLLLTFNSNAQWQNLYSFPNPVYSFITCNNNLFAGLGGGGVYMSQDSGNTWVAVNNGIQFGGAYIYSLTSQNDSIYAGGFGEVCFSNDSGANWSLLNLNIGLNDFVYALIIKDNFLFAGVGHGTNNGVYRKPLNGSTWSQLNNGLPTNVPVHAFVTDTNLLVAGTDSGIYVSSNNGVNWNWSSSGINSGLAVKSLITVNGNILAGTTDGVFISSNHGSSWSSTYGLPPSSITVSFTNNSSYIVTGTYESAFFSSDNGWSWSRISNGLDSIVSIYSLTSLGNYIYAGTGGGITTSNSAFRFAYNTLSSPENNFEPDGALSVFPNPFCSSVTLRSETVFKNATLNIYNSFGQQINKISNIFGYEIKLDRDNLPSGIYFIQMVQDNKTLTTRKLIITDN